MGSLCSSLFGSSASTTYQPPEAVKNAVTDILNRAATQSNQPYPQYTPDVAASYSNYNPGLLAPMTPNQVAAGQSISNLQGYTQPNFQAATGLAAAAATPLQMRQFSPGAVNQYLNPYLQDVVGSAVSNINQTNAQQQQQVLGNAIQRGAFGGDRAGIAQAELARQQNLANNATIANLLGQGYNQAQQMFTQQQGVDLAAQLQNRQLAQNAALNLANLGTQGQQAALQQAQAQYGYGTAEQQQQQAGLSTAYQQYLNQQAFPYQQLSYYAGLASGAAPALGGTTTGYSPTGSLAGNTLFGLNTLGTLTQPSTYSSGGMFSGIGNLFSSASSALPAIFANGGRVERATGGRTGYAAGGAPSQQDIISAYNDYINLSRSGAPMSAINQAYRRYQQSLQGAPAPWNTNPVSAAITAASTQNPSSGSASATNTGGGGSSGSNAQSVNPTPYPNIGNSSVYPQGGAEIINGEPVTPGQNETLNAVLRGNAPLITGSDNPSKGLLSGLIGGVNPSTGAQTGIAGAIDALIHGNSPGTLNSVLNAQNRVAYGTRDDGTAYPNTTSGLTAAEWAAQMGVDPKNVKGSIVNGQIDWYDGSKALGDLLHPGGLPASQLSPQVDTQTQDTSEADKPAVAAKNASADLTEGSGKTINLSDLGKAYGLPAGYLEGQLMQESGLNPDAKSKSSSATGLGQFTKGTSAALGIDPTDVVQSAYGAATLNQQNAAALAKAGIEATPANLSLAYQFGAEGAKAIIQNPNSTIFDALKTVQNDDQALKAVVGNKYNISDTNQSVLDNVGRNINASMRSASQQDLNIPTRTLQSPSLNDVLQDDNPERTQAVENAAKQNQINEGLAAINNANANAAKQYDQGLGNLDSAAKQAQTDQDLAEKNIANADATKQYESGSRDINQPEPMTRSLDEAADRDMAGAESVGGGSEEKRGGRIKKYAQGGYTPITMQYGLPTESDLEQAAQSLAGIGVGRLPGTAEALAAKGVLPSAKGGRIYKQVAGSVGNPDDDTWTDPNQQPGFLEKGLNYIYNKTFGPEADLDKAYSVGKEVLRSSAETPEQTRQRVAAETPRAYGRDPGQEIEQTAPKDPVTGKEIKAGAGQLTRKPMSPNEAYAPSDVKPVPANQKSFDMSQFDNNTSIGNEQNAAPQDRQIKVAQAQPQTMNDATREVIPGVGIKQWYNAPQPRNLSDIASWNFAANLSGSAFGAAAARAGHDYANTILAQQAEQRSTMTTEAQAAQQRAAALESSVRAAKEKLNQRGPFANQIVTNPDGTISFIEVPGFESGYGEEPSSGQNGIQQFTAQNYETTPLDVELGPSGGVGDNPESINKNFAFRKYYAPDRKRIMADPDGSKKQFELDSQFAQAAASTASDTQNNLYQQAVAITKLPDHGMLKAGAGSQWRQTAYDYFKTALPPGTLAALGIENPDDLANSQVANKIATVAAQRLGNDAAATWKTILRAAQPGTDLQKGASNELITAALIAQKRDKDRLAVMHEYGNRSAGYGPSGVSLMNDINPPRLYARDQTILRDIFDNKNIQTPDPRNPGLMTTENPATLLIQNIITPDQFDKKIDEIYGPRFGIKHLHLSQYFK